MSLMQFLMRRKGEIALVLISAWAVCTVCMNGFYLDDLLANIGWGPRAAIAFVLTAILTLTLYVVSFNRARRAAGIALYIVLLAILVFAAFALSTSDAGPQADAEGNYLYAVLCAAFSATVCFLLSRTLTGSMAWFVVAAFACSLIQAFYQSEEIVMSMVAAISALSLIVYKNFKSGVEGAQLAQGASSRFAFITSLVPALLACCIGLFVWFAVIAPLNPGVLNVKLFTELRTLPVEEYIGTSDEHPQLNYDLKSQNIVDGDPYTTDDLKEDVASDAEIDAASALEQQQLAQMGGSGTGGSSGGGSKQDYSEDSDDAQYDPYGFMNDWPWAVIWIIVALLIAAAITAFFIIRRKRREKRLRAWLSLEPREGVIEMYRFLLSRLERLGFKQPEGMTLREYAATAARQMDIMTEETEVSFISLTETYVACVYGDYEPTEDDVVPFAAYYLRFWKAARSHLGNLKYFFKSFRL